MLALFNLTAVRFALRHDGFSPLSKRVAALLLDSLEDAPQMIDGDSLREIARLAGATRLDARELTDGLTADATATETGQAFANGVAAFGRGETRAPILDPAHRAVLDSKREIGETIPVAKAWLRGWDTANAFAEVEDAV